MILLLVVVPVVVVVLVVEVCISTSEYHVPKGSDCDATWHVFVTLNWDVFKNLAGHKIVMKKYVELNE